MESNTNNNSRHNNQLKNRHSRVQKDLKKILNNRRHLVTILATESQFRGKKPGKCRHHRCHLKKQQTTNK